MSRQGIANARRCYHHDLLRAIGKCLPHFGLPLQVEDRRMLWTPRLLVMAAILLSWLPGANRGECFTAAREAVVALYPSRRRPGETLSGFLDALSRQSGPLLAVVRDSLRRRTEEMAGESWRIGPWAVLAADGSRVECPMTRANEKGLGCAGKKKTAPQLFVTTLYSVFTGLPWGWVRGRGDSSERGQLRRMRRELPERTLLLMDAGFPGYALLRSLQAKGHDFIVRVGRNVGLLRGLGWEYKQKGSTVYLWPKNHRKRPPLKLRLVTIRSKGRNVYLLTSVLGQGTLSDAQIARLYRLRWGVEVMYRSLKQTLDHHKMRSDTPRRAAVELDWYMVGLWMLGLMTAQSKGPRQRKLPWSPARAMSSVRTAMRNARRPRRKGGLRRQLSQAVRDTYVRRGPKKARHYPRQKNEPPAGRPKIRTATPAEIAAAQAFRPPKPSNYFAA
jgi:hypothetical protein